MRYIVILSLLTLLQNTAALADAPMSPAVKSYLCTLAKRDAAITPEQIAAHEMEVAACLAQPDPEGIVGEDYDCTTQRSWGSNPFKPKATVNCSKRYKEKKNKCPEPTRKLEQRVESAPERIEKYCTDE